MKYVYRFLDFLWVVWFVGVGVVEEHEFEEFPLVVGDDLEDDASCPEEHGEQGDEAADDEGGEAWHESGVQVLDEYGYEEH